MGSTASVPVLPTEARDAVITRWSRVCVNADTEREPDDRRNSWRVLGEPGKSRAHVGNMAVNPNSVKRTPSIPFINN